MIPYLNESREDYVQRAKERHLLLAHMFEPHGTFHRSMWLQLFYWAMADDIYGAHWDKLQENQ